MNPSPEDYIGLLRPHRECGLPQDPHTHESQHCALAQDSPVALEGMAASLGLWRRAGGRHRAPRVLQCVQELGVEKALRLLASVDTSEA